MTKEEILAELGMTEQELAEEHRKFREDHIWVEEHREELTALYPDEWVLVFDKQVIDHDKDPDELRKRLHALPEKIMRRCVREGTLWTGIASFMTDPLTKSSSPTKGKRLFVMATPPPAPAEARLG